MGARKRRNHDSTGFGLPPGVHQRRFAVANIVAVPVPYFRIDRLANGTDYLERAQIAGGDRLFTLLHQCAHGSRSGVELGNLVLIAHVPETSVVRIGRNALEHDRRSANGQRAIDDVGVSGNPADVGRAPPNVAILVVKDILKGRGRINHVAAGRVQYALGLTG